MGKKVTYFRVMADAQLELTKGNHGIIARFIMWARKKNYIKPGILISMAESVVDGDNTRGYEVLHEFFHDLGAESDQAKWEKDDIIEEQETKKEETIPLPDLRRVMDARGDIMFVDAKVIEGEAVSAIEGEYLPYETT
jgi:hypothetical protein